MSPLLREKIIAGFMKARYPLSQSDNQVNLKILLVTMNVCGDIEIQNKAIR
jgi:hypothetical protein